MSHESLAQIVESLVLGDLQKPSEQDPEKAVLGNSPCLSRGIKPDDFQIPFQPKPFSDFIMLWYSNSFQIFNLKYIIKRMSVLKTKN